MVCAHAHTHVALMATHLKRTLHTHAHSTCMHMHMHTTHTNTHAHTHEKHIHIHVRCGQIIKGLAIYHSITNRTTQHAHTHANVLTRTHAHARSHSPQSHSQSLSQSHSHLHITLGRIDADKIIIHIAIHPTIPLPIAHHIHRQRLCEVPARNNTRAYIKSKKQLWLFSLQEKLSKKLLLCEI